MLRNYFWMDYVFQRIDKFQKRYTKNNMVELSHQVPAVVYINF